MTTTSDIGRRAVPEIVTALAEAASTSDAPTANHIALAIRLAADFPNCQPFRKARLLSNDFFRYARERLADPDLEPREAIELRNVALGFQNEWCAFRLHNERLAGELLASMEASA